jgi:hypothetical protein
MMNLLLLFFVGLLVSSESNAVVSGKGLSKVLLEANAFVAITLKLKGLPDVPCSGTYIGNGQILTAAHCLLMNDYPEVRPEICLQTASASAGTASFESVESVNMVTKETIQPNISGNDDASSAQNCFVDHDYEVLFPPKVEDGPKAPTRKLRKVISIPKPDMAVIRIKPELTGKLIGFATIPMVTDATEIFADSNWQVQVVGQGCTAFTEPGDSDPTPGIGVFRYSKIQLNQELTSPLEYFAIWTKDNQNAGLCWGDSGGSLIAINKQSQKIVQLAVNSSTKRTYSRATGYTASVKNMFSRVDQESTSNWLKQIIRNY